VGTVLNQIWEEDFLGFSTSGTDPQPGFRPERGQPGSPLVSGALDALWVGIVRKKVNWILDLDTLAYVPYSIFFSTNFSTNGWSSLWNIGLETSGWSA